MAKHPTQADLRPSTHCISDLPHGSSYETSARHRSRHPNFGDEAVMLAFKRFPLYGDQT
jgi:hypothetical protein